MASEQAKQTAEFFASIAERTAKAHPDVATMRDINEGLHLCGTEPEGVTYAEVDAGYPFHITSRATTGTLVAGAEHAAAAVSDASRRITLL